MNVWQCDELGEKKSKSALRKPSHTLSCRSPPIACDVAYRPGRGSANGVGRKRKAGARDGVQERDACYYVLSIQPDRAVVFEVRLGVKGVSECTIQERGAGERRASGEGVMGENSFLFGQFVGTDSVVIVRGSLARPHFESVVRIYVVCKLFIASMHRSASLPCADRLAALREGRHWRAVTNDRVGKVEH